MCLRIMSVLGTQFAFTLLPGMYLAIPGTGMSYVTTKNVLKHRPQESAEESPPEDSTSRKKPSWYSAEYEKLYAKGVNEFAAENYEQASKYFQAAAHSDARSIAVADDLMAGLSLMILGKTDDATPFLERVIFSRVSLPDSLMRKYGIPGELTIRITKLFRATIPIGSLAAAIALAEIYQVKGRVQDAVQVLRQLCDFHLNPVVALSYCDLLCELKEWKLIVEAASPFPNSDDVSLALCLLRARALVELNLHDAAFEVLKTTIRSKKRTPELLKEARYYRGCVFLKLGKRAAAKKELSMVYAVDPKYRKTEAILGRL